jgi:hypothetical protein
MYDNPLSSMNQIPSSDGCQRFSPERVGYSKGSAFLKKNIDLIIEKIFIDSHSNIQDDKWKHNWV